MIQLISIEFLVIFLFIIDLFLIFLIFLLVKRVNRIRRNVAEAVRGQDDDILADQEIAMGDAAATAGANAVKEISQMLEPLLKASQSAALEFDLLIREKKKLSKDLNHALDSKMISMNLLLSRAGEFHKKLEEQLCEIRRFRPGTISSPSFRKEPDVLDQQNQILNLYYEQMDINTIAQRLSIPKGEVQLVIDLKEKFVAMEQGS